MSKFDVVQARINRLKEIESKAKEQDDELFNLVYANLQFIKNRVAGLSNKEKFKAAKALMIRIDIAPHDDAIDKNKAVLSLLQRNGIISSPVLYHGIYFTIYTLMVLATSQLVGWMFDHSNFSVLASGFAMLIFTYIIEPFDNINFYRVRNED